MIELLKKEAALNNGYIDVDYTLRGTLIENPNAKTNKLRNSNRNKNNNIIDYPQPARPTIPEKADDLDKAS